MDGAFEKLTGWHVKRGNRLYRIVGTDGWEAERDLVRLLDHFEDMVFDESPLYHINGEYMLELPAHHHVILNDKWEMRNYCPFFRLDRDYTTEDHLELIKLLRSEFWHICCICSGNRKFDPTKPEHIRLITSQWTEELAEHDELIKRYPTFQEYSNSEAWFEQ